MTDPRSRYSWYDGTLRGLVRTCHVITGGGASNVCARARLRDAIRLCKVLHMSVSQHYDM